MAALYLIPVTLGDTPHDRVLPAANADIVRSIRHFVVEEIRTARRFLKAVDRNIDIDALTFHEMGKHADPARFSSFLAPLRKAKTWVSSAKPAAPRWPIPVPTWSPSPSKKACASCRWSAPRAFSSL